MSKPENEDFEQAVELIEHIMMYRGEMMEQGKLRLILENLIRDYGEFLYNNNYTDSDIWCEEPKAVDRFCSGAE
jgi:hypothetical protein